MIKYSVVIGEEERGRGKEEIVVIVMKLEV